MDDVELARLLQAEEDFLYEQEQQHSRQLSAASGSHVRAGCDRKEEFCAILSSGIAQVAEYEDELLQALALSAIPTRLLVLKDSQTQDQLARELLAWFKQDFFTWVNNPVCQFCECKSTTLVGRAHPVSTEEIEGRAQVVEIYKCLQCGKESRFPRYNHPGKLLETRRGRCGEWANAFTLICRAAGLEARWVRDWTDHVWTEYYSPMQQKWVHLDPCENEFDKPHLYEGGWGKKLSYVIGFSRHGAADVSCRYSVNHLETLERQKRISEPEWVAQQCRSLTRRLRGSLPQTQVLLWEERDRKEQAELMSGAGSMAVDPLLPGRQTGTTEWRASRGELGKQGADAEQNRPEPQQAAAETPLPQLVEAADEATALQSISQVAFESRDAKAWKAKLPEGEDESSALAALSSGAKSANIKEREGFDADKDEFTRRMQAEFAELMASGEHEPNTAAVLALAHVTGTS